MKNIFNERCNVNWAQMIEDMINVDVYKVFKQIVLFELSLI